MSKAMRVALILIAGLSLSQAVYAQTPAQKAMWEDFNHHVLIARPDLAKKLGQQLLKLNDQKLLDIVESSTYTEYDKTLFRAQKIESLTKVAKALSKKIQFAQIKRSRNPQRIASDIKKLSQGMRANHNATQRLQAAGQFAAPALLAILRDDAKQHLHPYVMAAMVAVGRPMVYPLASAINDLEPIAQGQVARVLAEIGYPRSLPYLKEVIENPKTDPTAKQTVQSAYSHLSNIAGVPPHIEAAELFMTLAQNHYDAAVGNEPLPGFDPSDQKGLVWKFGRHQGLLSTQVPGRVFGYILAMRASRQAMLLNPHMSPALSLWLAANLSRENKMPKGAKDPSYPRKWLDAAYYLKTAGPLRQHDVLQKALDDHDHVLALDAINALQATAGTDALVNQYGTIQPLIAALSYPDRRVRFNAALTMGQARPSEPFVGSYRVVPVLTEAIRQTDKPFAVVLADDMTTANRLAGVLRAKLGYKTAAGEMIDDVTDAISAGPGVDLIVVASTVDGIVEANRARRNNYKLVASPMLALTANSADLAQINALFENQPTIFPLLSGQKASELKGVLGKAIKAYAGDPINAKEAAKFANDALDMLWEIAIGHGHVFKAVEAEPALISTLNDARPSVVVKSAKVLALFDSTRAQRAIADAAMDSTRDKKIRVALLNSLAKSATGFGNKLNELQIEKLLKIVRQSKGDLAHAAARAHGGLTLPASHVVQMIAR